MPGGGAPFFLAAPQRGRQGAQIVKDPEAAQRKGRDAAFQQGHLEQVRIISQDGPGRIVGRQVRQARLDLAQGPPEHLFEFCLERPIRGKSHTARIAEAVIVTTMVRHPRQAGGHRLLDAGLGITHNAEDREGQLFRQGLERGQQLSLECGGAAVVQALGHERQAEPRLPHNVQAQIALFGLHPVDPDDQAAQLLELGAQRRNLRRLGCAQQDQKVAQ